MNGWPIFREDVERILTAIAIARDGLTTDERTILIAVCAGFGINPAEVLPPQVTARAANEGEGDRRDG